MCSQVIYFIFVISNDGKHDILSPQVSGLLNIAKFGILDSDAGSPATVLLQCRDTSPRSVIELSLMATFVPPEIPVTGNFLSLLLIKLILGEIILFKVDHSSCRRAAVLIVRSVVTIGFSI